MTQQIQETLRYNDQVYRMYGRNGRPLENFFELHGNRPLFLVQATSCWRGYVGAWSLVDGKLWLDCLDGYIAKGALVEIANGMDGPGGLFGHPIDYEDQTLCSKATLENLFPDAEGSVFARWFSGEIETPLSDEVKSIDGEEVVVERTLKLGFRDGLLISENVELEYLPTPRDIENGLTSTDVSVRRQFAKSLESNGESNAAPEQIRRGLLDEDSSVRQSFIQAAYSLRMSFSLTPEQLERALTDDNTVVRHYAYSLNGDPTPFHLERGLNDKSPMIRAKVANEFGDRLTPEQIERGLIDEDGEVRAAFAAGSFKFTTAQIERGLTDESWEVRHWFATNPAIELSPEQIQRGLKDDSELISLEIASRYNREV